MLIKFVTEMKTWESEPFYFMISIVSENKL